MIITPSFLSRPRGALTCARRGGLASAFHFLRGPRLARTAREISGSGGPPPPASGSRGLEPNPIA